ncbi:hypothetical protein C1E23_00710 [Pseudoalteromonas phenolica]|uniref:Uncharacterized protein n=1 Tax=Pseudoalteromonas phenolica TaxID=161398 RepID=A0A4Q7ITS3_9GAMM|nr:hypothetical protein [Pseudoalteromonas phenolica]RZQ55089.1 hypothetical protein C1E23_00710 [Pseudoalteromonas phenolica]
MSSTSNYPIIPQQPLPREGEQYDATPLEITHVNTAVHDTWLRAISIVWNDKLNEKPWKFNGKKWEQITSELEDAELADLSEKNTPEKKEFYKSFKEFLIGNPTEAFSVLGFNDPDEYARECQPASLPPISVLCAEDALNRLKQKQNGEEPNSYVHHSLESQVLRRFEIFQNAEDIEKFLADPYKFEQGKNGWYTQNNTYPALLLSQLILVIPPKPKDPQDQAMALADYKLAGLSYPCTMCAE